jgi:putative nucleotidyltransferase with HDIG domain
MTLPASQIDMDFLRTLTVLYVEDEEEVREALSRFLRRRFANVDVAENGKVGLEYFRTGQYDVVITDVKMPVMDGLAMATEIKALREEMPVIVVTAYNETDYFMRAIEIGVDRYVKKPVDPEQLVEAVYKATRNRFQQRELERERQRTVDTLTQTIAALGRSIEKRDPYTDGHQKRVSQLAVAIAEEMGLSKEQITGIRYGALIHDIGNISVPAEILSMPRKLQPPEYSLVKTHPANGAEILGDIDFPWPLTDILSQHHERMDGSGYPGGLKDEAISLEARIVAVADVVEAMSSHRPYRPALGIDAAIAEIQAHRSTLYDPQVVDACVALLLRHDKAFWQTP